MPYKWDERRVLVTGATGIVGSWLCEDLLSRGANVVALVQDDDPQSRFYAEGIFHKCTIVNGDLSNLSDCLRAVNNHDVEILFHLGAQTIVGAALRNPWECFESNIHGTYNILEAARRFPELVKCAVVASSDKAYGDSPVLPYTEDMPLRGSHPYDVSKSCTDLIAHAYAHTYALNVTIARCGNIYGGGDLNWSRIVPGTIRSLLSGSAPILRSDGTLIRDYIYVKDVVAAYTLLAERSFDSSIAGEAFNFSTDSGCSVLEIVAEISKVMGAKIAPKIENTATMEIRNQTLDSNKARKTLSWSPRWALRDGLQETVAWYTRHLHP